MVKANWKLNNAWEVIRHIADPELPFLTLEDLGVVRGITSDSSGLLYIEITPTYIGCPGMTVVQETIQSELKNKGYKSTVTRSFSPPWTTDWITEKGRQKLESAGISPPQPKRIGGTIINERNPITCVRCGSMETEKISEFGASACKALYRCLSCGEPFDHFKCI